MTNPGPHDAVTSCSNMHHPDGAWHAATPIPPTWERAALRQYEARERTWGCGCEALHVEPKMEPLSWWSSFIDRAITWRIARRDRRAKAKRERDRLSGWNPRIGVYEKGGLRPSSPPPPPKVHSKLPKAPPR